MRASRILMAAVLAAAAAGCGAPQQQALRHSREVGRPDAAWPAEMRARGIRPPEWSGQFPEEPAPPKRTGYTFNRTPILEVVELMRSRFGCQVTLTPEAATYILANDPRVTSGIPGVPDELGFEVLRGLIEAKGLTVSEAPGASVLGAPHFLIDRSTLRETSISRAD